MYDTHTTVGDFLRAASAKQPTPGGGSVAALVGALGVSMGEMAINYSIGKKGLEAYACELKPALDELSKARQLMLQLMVEDQLAYEAMTAARKLPDSTADKAARMDAALVACIRIPQALAAAGVAVLELVDRIKNFVNPYLLSDLAVCADLAMATTRCAIYNVRANLPQLKDAADKANLESAISSLLARAASLIQQAAPRIWERFRLEA